MEPLVTLVASDFLARDLINMPASDLNPNRFEKLVKEIVSKGTKLPSKCSKEMNF